MPADMCRTGGGEHDCAGGAGRRTGAGDNLLIQCIPVLLLRTLQSARAAERRWRRFLPEGSVHLFPIQSLRRRSLVFLVIDIFLCPPLLRGTCERIAAWPARGLGACSRSLRTLRTAPTDVLRETVLGVQGGMHLEGGLGMMPDSSMARYVSTGRSWLRNTNCHNFFPRAFGCGY